MRCKLQTTETLSTLLENSKARRASRQRWNSSKITGYFNLTMQFVCKSQEALVGRGTVLVQMEKLISDVNIVKSIN